MPQAAILRDHVDVVFELAVLHQLLGALIDGATVDAAVQHLAPRAWSS